MDYVVQVVGDDELPEGIDHIVVERGGVMPPVLLINGAPGRCWQTMCDYQDVAGTGRHGGAQVVWPAEPLLYAV